MSDVRSDGLNPQMVPGGSGWSRWEDCWEKRSESHQERGRRLRGALGVRSPDYDSVQRGAGQVRSYCGNSGGLV